MLAYVDPACGRPAFLMTARPASGERAMSRDVRHLDGRQMEYNAPCVCENCGRTLPFVLLTCQLRTMIGPLE